MVPDNCQVITGSNMARKSIHPLEIILHEIWLKTQELGRKLYFQISTAKCSCLNVLTHWGRVTHICVGNLTIIVSDNGLSPGRRQAIIWNNAGILSIGPLGTSFSEILIEILIFSFKKMHFKVSSAKWQPFCLGLSVLSQHCRIDTRHVTRIRCWHIHVWSDPLPEALVEVYHDIS